MKKIFKRALVIFLALALIFSAIGCGGGKVDDNNTLEIYVYEQGYGINWVKQIIESFKNESWVKEKYPELIISTPIDNRTDEFGDNQLQLGSRKNTFDLLFTTQVGSYYGSNELLDLTDIVYNAKVPGEDVTYSEKLNDSVESNYLFTEKNTGKEKYYAVPWQGGMSAILYNKTRLDNLDFDAPRTTDELLDLCQKAKDKGIPAIIQSNDTQYCNVFLNVWWAQYDGVEGYENFYNGIDADGEISNKIFTDYQGRLKALEVLEGLFDFENGYIDNGSFNDGFMTSQSNFLQGKKGLIHFNGDWFSQEMQVTKNNLIANNRNVDDIRLLKTPIVSAIVDKCDTIKGEGGNTADNELSALIKAIDEGSTALAGEGYNVSLADFNRIKDARCIVNGTFGNTMGVVPAYAKGKDVAVDFLKYMATDKALSVYAQATLGASLDFDFDLKADYQNIYNDLPQLNKDRIDYFTANNISTLKNAASFPLNVYGGVNAFYNTRYYQTFATIGGTTTALDIYNKTIQEWTAGKFQSAVGNAWD